MADASARGLGVRLVKDAALRDAAGRFFAALSDAGIAGAPIKGLAVSAALYDDPIAREFGDVDVLVAYRDVARVVELAKRRGFGLVVDSKQLGCVNVVVPPGVPFDVRGSIGPPCFAAISGADILARARRREDSRVCGGRFFWLDDHDHLLVLLVDALMDKLTVKAAVRQEDLPRALAAWLGDPTRFAARAHEAGLAAVSDFVLRWLDRTAPNEAARRAIAALGPLPPLAAAVGSRVTRRIAEGRPHAWSVRIGIRFVADRPERGVASLALGAAGAIRYLMYNWRRPPWHEPLWDGRGDSRSSDG